MNRKKIGDAQRKSEFLTSSILKVRRANQGQGKGRQSPTLNSDPTQELVKGSQVQPGNKGATPTHLKTVGTPLPGGSGNPHSQPALPAGGKEHPRSLAPAGHASGGCDRRSDRT